MTREWAAAALILTATLGLFLGAALCRTAARPTPVPAADWDDVALARLIAAVRQVTEDEAWADILAAIEFDEDFVLWDAEVES